MQVQQCSKGYKNAGSIQKMTLIQLPNKQQFDSLSLSQLSSVNDNDHLKNNNTIAPSSLRLSSQLKQEKISQPKQQKVLSLSMSNKEQSLPNKKQQQQKHQLNIKSRCQSIAVPRCGKVTQQKLITKNRKQKGLVNNNDTQQQSVQSLIEHSGYFRYIPYSLLLTIHNNESTHPSYSSTLLLHQSTLSLNQPTLLHQSQLSLSLESYLPTQPDIQFLHRLRQQYKPKLSHYYTLSTKTFCDIISSCQHNYHKTKTINLQTSTNQNILLKLQFKLPSKLTTLKVEHRVILSDMFKEVIQYWRKVKLQHYKLFPMVRTLWPKTDLQQLKYSYFIPYKSRTLSKNPSQQLTNKNQHQLKQKHNKIISIYSPKYPITSSTIRNKLGRTQRQVKINRQSKQLSIFYQQVKQIAKENYDQRQLFYKEFKKFHKLSDLYYLKKPQWYSNVLNEKNKNERVKNKDQRVKNKDQRINSIGSQMIVNQVNNLSNQPYFSHPVVRLRSLKTHQQSKNWELQRQYNINYDNRKSQLVIMPINDIKRNKRVKKSS